MDDEVVRILSVRDPNGWARAYCEDRGAKLLTIGADGSAIVDVSLSCDINVIREIATTLNRWTGMPPFLGRGFYYLDGFCVNDDRVPMAYVEEDRAREFMLQCLDPDGDVRLMLAGRSDAALEWVGLDTLVIIYSGDDSVDALQAEVDRACGLPQSADHLIPVFAVLHHRSHSHHRHTLR